MEADGKFPAWKPGEEWPAVAFPYEFEIVNCIQALRWGKCPGAGIEARMKPDTDRRSKWWQAGLVFEGNMHRQSSDRHMKRQTCTLCQCPGDYDSDAHEHNMDSVYRDGNVWRTSVYKAGHVGGGKPCASAPYEGKMSLRAQIESGEVTPMDDMEPDGISTSLIMEALDMG